MTATDPAGLVDSDLVFPPGFFWGAATAAFQIEGAVTADGRGQSIWDTFSATPGKVLNGDTGDPACDHYHRYREDVALMAELGLEVYRFSVSWPRIQPTGSGRVESRGLDFYDRLVDELLAQGIRPMATLYHWDLPQALEDKGGWVNRDTAQRFAEYSSIVFSALSDRVRTWSTLNEPWCSAFLGYCGGIHAPGITDPAASLKAAHHLLLGHGLAMQALRAQSQPDHTLSIVLNLSPVWTDGVDHEHREAVRKVDGLQNRLLLDPLLGRGYPADVLADVDWLGDWEMVIRDGDMDAIATPIDWLGVNFYQPTWVAPADPAFVTPGNMPGLKGVEMLPPRGPLTGFGWGQQADALTELLLWLHNQAPKTPIVVTENGSSFPDRIVGGAIMDTERTQYLLNHVRAVHTAITNGADVRGYLAWSLLDNFEWAVGYSQRFGIIHVDFETQKRTIKQSAQTLATLARTNRLPA